MKGNKHNLFNYTLVFFLIGGALILYTMNFDEIDISSAAPLNIPDICENNYDNCEKECSSQLDVIDCKETCISEYINCRDKGN
ncbi:hypothetical protein KY312_02915 [Candidatus Woesearchaeota archaeon]|nr:hypothetical protein [Candidatus Woesearchaeota archaeon]